MAADTAGGGLGQLEAHYQSFIVGDRLSKWVFYRFLPS